MTFVEMRDLMIQHFNSMAKDADRLFCADIDKDQLWELYLNSFPKGTNNFYRERTEHDCSCCRHFIKTFGGVVVIKDNHKHTIWEFQTNDSTYQPVLDAMDRFVKAHPITDVFITRDKRIGTDKNYEKVEDGNILTWDHFYLDLPSKFLYFGRESIPEVMGQMRDTRNVFKRSLDDITVEAIETVLELIYSNTLYRGSEWKEALKSFLKYKKEYEVLSPEEKEIYAWDKSKAAGVTVGRIRNHSIGVLLSDISSGVNLNEAVTRYERIVAPTNYKRPKAIFTKKMVEDAKKTIEELGYADSLQRRFATLDDITVNNILFSNKDAAKRIQKTDVFEEMINSISKSPKKFSKTEEISIDNFIKDVLPYANEIETFVENRHTKNFVSLIAPQNKESKPMFKWNNGFSWAYTGNIADSNIKENVKSAGGNVNGVLRFSIQWNDEDYNPNDFDAHCKESNGNEIFYPKKRMVQPSSGMLDVDIVSPKRGVPAVENIVWTNKKKMAPGKYIMKVHCFNNNGGRSGFKAEIEFDNQVYQFNYDKELRQDETIEVAYVNLDENGKFTIAPQIDSSASSKEIWGIKTNEFIPVSVIMFSPNYWDEQSGIGNKHYFFMLKDCINPEEPNGYYNEFLKEELLKHKRVFEALGSKMKVESVEDQLSGIGFSSTQRNDLIVRVKGQIERTMKIKF